MATQEQKACWRKHLAIIFVSLLLLLMTVERLMGWQMFAQQAPCLNAGAIEPADLRPTMSSQPRPALRVSSIRPGRRKPRVAASIALHPPKFWAAARFLSQWYNCPAARDAMSIIIVIRGEEDMYMFKKGMATIHPDVPADSWHGLVCEVPAHSSEAGGVTSQIISAWKKWYGITYMMDLGEDAPTYGLLLDSELLLYNTSDCGPSSEWHRLYDRIAGLEAAKLWPAAQINDAASYNFGQYTQTGRDYDRVILSDTAHVIGAHPEQDQCKEMLMPGCREIKRQIDLVLFSWWTDLPYVNLKVAERMLPAIVSHSPKSIPHNESIGHWCRLMHRVFMQRFEHIVYQQWCVMHEGYHFDDVTVVTDYAVWGSYLEAPHPSKGYGSSRIAELHPLWLPADAYMAIKQGLVPPMSDIDPPLLYLHVDHHLDVFDCYPEMDAWRKFYEIEDAKKSLTTTGRPRT